jgi:simple sugar transport system ATP-binding protein
MGSSDAMSIGIYMVHQHFSLVPTFTVLENLSLVARKGIASSLARLDYRGVEARAREVMKTLNLEVPLDIPVESLSLGVRRRAEVLKALFVGANVLILDEPTSFLTPYEARELFRFIKDLSLKGATVIFITHRIREAIEVTDRIVVLRKGRVAGEIPTELATPEKLSEMMVGKEVEMEDREAIHKLPQQASEPILRIKDLVVINDLGVPAVKGVNLELYPGEILGIAGVEGNGQAELVEAITGLRKALSGRVILGDTDMVNKNPSEIYRLGIIHLPSDRDRLTLAPDMKIYENALIGLQRSGIFLYKKLVTAISWRRVRTFARELVKTFSIAASDIDAKARSLSGGNRQRLVLAGSSVKGPRS